MAENNIRAWHAVLTKGSAALKKKLTDKHGDKPEFQRLLRSTGQDKETWYKMHQKKQARLRGEDPRAKEKERKEIGLKAWGATKGTRMGGEEGGGLSIDAPTKAGTNVVGQPRGAGEVKTLSVAEYMKQKEEEERRQKAKAILAARKNVKEDLDEGIIKKINKRAKRLAVGMKGREKLGPVSKDLTWQQNIAQAVKAGRAMANEETRVDERNDVWNPTNPDADHGLGGRSEVIKQNKKKSKNIDANLALLQRLAAAGKRIAAEEVEQTNEASYMDRPGWMLRADPKLAKKFKEIKDREKVKAKYAGKTSAEIAAMRKEEAEQVDEDNLGLRGLVSANPQSMPDYAYKTKKGKEKAAKENISKLKSAIRDAKGRHPKPNLPEEVEHNFKVGDKVTINSPNDLDWHEREGVIKSTSDTGHTVKLKGGGHLVVGKKQLKLKEEAEQSVAEGRYIQTPYGWAGGSKPSGGTYKHPEQIKADREAKDERDVHLVKVTVSDPDVKSKEPMLKGVRVRATSEGDALKKARTHFRRAGYKVHDAYHHSIIKPVQKEEAEQIDELSRLTLANYIGKARERNIRMGAAAKVMNNPYTPVDVVMKNIVDREKRHKNLERAKNKVKTMKEGTRDLTAELANKIKKKTGGKETAVRNKAGLLVLVPKKKSKPPLNEKQEDWGEGGRPRYRDDDVHGYTGDPHGVTVHDHNGERIDGAGKLAGGIASDIHPRDAIKRGKEILSWHRLNRGLRGGEVRQHGKAVYKIGEAVALDKVGRETADIDNDGNVDKTDMYLHNRRGAIKKAIAKKKLNEGKAAAAADKAIALQRGKGNRINRKPTMEVDLKAQASPPPTHTGEDNSANAKV